MGRWTSEKGAIDEIRATKEKLESLRIQAEQAERAGDYGKVAEIRYGKITEAEQKLVELQAKHEQTNNSKSMLQEVVTSEDIAEVVFEMDRNSSN